MHARSGEASRSLGNTSCIIVGVGTSILTTIESLDRTSPSRRPWPFFSQLCGLRSANLSPGSVGRTPVPQHELQLRRARVRTGRYLSASALSSHQLLGVGNAVRVSVSDALVGLDRIDRTCPRFIFNLVYRTTVRDVNVYCSSWRRDRCIDKVAKNDDNITSRCRRCDWTPKFELVRCDGCSCS